MKKSKPITRDPICGMTVDAATALHAERGKMFYFCSEHCMRKFLSTRRRRIQNAQTSGAGGFSV